MSDEQQILDICIYAYNTVIDRFRAFQQISEIGFMFAVDGTPGNFQVSFSFDIGSNVTLALIPLRDMPNPYSTIYERSAQHALNATESQSDIETMVQYAFQHAEIEHSLLQMKHSLSRAPRDLSITGSKGDDNHILKRLTEWIYSKFRLVQ